MGMHARTRCNAANFQDSRKAFSVSKTRATTNNDIDNAAQYNAITIVILRGDISETLNNRRQAKNQ